MPEVTNSETHTEQSFISWIIKEKHNFKFLWIVVIATLAQFTLFKFLYPFADFFGDSYSYIYAAYANLDINIWPIGYSKFLRAFHGITYSDTALIAFQYFFLEAASLYFFFTVTYFFRPARNTSWFLFSFLFFNPLYLYMSNYVNSDPLFAALSLAWFTELIWIVRRPRIYRIFSQAILLFLAFTVRHNAMYYPFVSAIAFMLSSQQAWRKWTGVLSGLVLIIPFVLHERNAAYKMYGFHQFSPMSGWVLANNALYMYGHLKVDSSELPSVETRELDRLSKQFYRKVIPEFDVYLSNYSATFFMRQPDAPLKEYFGKHYNASDRYTSIVAWGRASAVFNAYGIWLIKHYPIEFARYFIWLNIKKYFLPPLEKMEVYNMGEKKIDLIAKFWFHYKSDRINSVSINLQGIVLFIFPVIFMLMNIYLLAKVVYGALLRQNRQTNQEFYRFLSFVMSFLFINFIFSISVSIVVFRYQFVPMIICLCATLLWADWADKKKIQIVPGL
ncbi:MAG TPA: hypothetical protein VGM30_04430 [Puia sp.]|jgi:hypothetical protein